MINPSVVRSLPAYTEKATGNAVNAICIRYLFHTPRGRQVVPVQSLYRSFEVSHEWVAETGAKHGDYIVWEDGCEPQVLSADDFDVHYRPRTA